MVSGKHPEDITLEFDFIIECQLCDKPAEDLEAYSIFGMMNLLTRVQEHVRERHRITADDMDAADMHVDREGEALIWVLPNGEECIRATRIRLAERECLHRWGMVSAEVMSPDRLHVLYECERCGVHARQAWGIDSREDIGNGPHFFPKLLPDPSRQEVHFRVEDE